MKETLKQLQKQGQEVYLFIRDRQVEGIIQKVENNIVHLLGEKFEYYIPLDHVLFIGLKLEPEKQRRTKAVGFTPVE